MLDLNQPLDRCSTQDMIAALMLQRYVHWTSPQEIRRQMEQVLLDLDDHRPLWRAFVMGPALPAIDGRYFPGSLICLRDLGLGWNADTLYILSEDFASAEAVRKLALRWGCTEITTYSAEQTEHLVSEEGILTAARWQDTTRLPQKIDYLDVYSNNPEIRLERSLPLGECSAQTLCAALMQRGQFGQFKPQQVLDDLQTYADTWNSFVMGPGLPEPEANLQGCLELLHWLPQEWGGDHLYVWAWGEADAMKLHSLSDRWECSESKVIEGAAAAQLLNLPNEHFVVMFTWKDSVLVHPA